MFRFYRFGPSLFYILLCVANIFKWSVKVRSEIETCFSLIHIQYLNDLDPKQLYVYEYSSFLLIVSFLTNTSIGGCLKKTSSSRTLLLSRGFYVEETLTITLLSAICIFIFNLIMCDIRRPK